MLSKVAAAPSTPESKASTQDAEPEQSGAVSGRHDAQVGCHRLKGS